MGRRGGGKGLDVVRRESEDGLRKSTFSEELWYYMTCNHLKNILACVYI